MAIGKITGTMLYPNLERQGADLAIDGNLFYFDVTNALCGLSEGLSPLSPDTILY